MTEFEQALVEALRARFQAMGLVRAATWGNPERWSRDDLATDLAPWVVAAIDAAAQAVHNGESGPAIEAAVLAALRGVP